MSRIHQLRQSAPPIRRRSLAQIEVEMAGVLDALDRIRGEMMRQGMKVDERPWQIASACYDLAVTVSSLASHLHDLAVTQAVPVPEHERWPWFLRRSRQ